VFRARDWLAMRPQGRQQKLTQQPGMKLWRRLFFQPHWWLFQLQMLSMRQILQHWQRSLFPAPLVRAAQLLQPPLLAVANKQR
jgi:hypothetical protein